MFLFPSLILLGQEKENYINSSDTVIYKISDLDSIPKLNYSRGNLQNDEIRAYIEDNQVWPTQHDGVFKVYIKFIIETNGTISNIAVLKGIHPDYDKEAIRLVETMPTWKPGLKNGQFVRTEMILPIKWTR